MYTLRIYKTAQKEIKKMSLPHQEAIVETLLEIQNNPQSGKQLKRNLKGLFSYRVGAYRAIYKLNKKDKIIKIITTGHRSRVYQ